MDACKGDDGKRTAQNSAQDVKVQPIEVAALLADDISQATNDFKPRFLVGEGSYAKVYRGVLMNDQPVAIKKLEYNEQPDREFLAQVWCTYALYI